LEGEKPKGWRENLVHFPKVGNSKPPVSSSKIEEEMTSASLALSLSLHPHQFP